MADSNVSAIPGVTKQAAPETEIRPDNPAEPENSKIPSPDMTDQEAAVSAHESETVRRETGEGQLEPPVPFDGDEHVFNSGDVVVSIEKGHKATKTAEKEAVQTAPAPEQQPEKKAAHRGRPPKAEKGQKPLKSSRSSKAASENKTQAKEEAPVPEQEQVPIPQEAPRSNEPEKIVYLNLSELHPFKNHPFQVRDDADMDAMVESVKAGGVNQPALTAGMRSCPATAARGRASLPVLRICPVSSAIFPMTRQF